MFVFLEMRHFIRALSYGSRLM